MTLLAVSLVLTAAACTSSPEEAARRHQQRAVTWLGQQPAVAAVTVEPTAYHDDDGQWVRVETQPDLPDAEVLALVDKMQDEVLSFERYRGTVLLSVDGMETVVHPSTGHQVIEPALWLRRDGRAASAVVGDHPDYVVTAAPCEVFGLVADYDDQAGPQVRATREVRSADGSARVRWTRSDELGMGLPRDAVAQLDTLCEEHPGTRGWVEGVTGRVDEVEGAVLLHPDDLPLEQVVDHVEALVDPSEFSRGLLLGWGGLRAGADAFAATFTGEQQEWAEIALDAGADRVLGPPDAGIGPDPRLRQVQVSDLDAWAEVHDRLHEVAGRRHLPIALFREEQPETALQSSVELHSASPLAANSVERELVAEVAPVQAVRRVFSGPVAMVVEGDISDADLDVVLAATARAYPRLDEELRVPVQAKFYLHDAEGTFDIGSIVEDEFVAEPAAGASGSTLPGRFADSWERVR